MLELLRSYNANALKQVLNSALEIAQKANASSEVKAIIREMKTLSGRLDNEIGKQLETE